MKRFERRVLDNGLTVLAERRGLGPVVFAGVVYRVGSRDERPGLTGISHVLEHMMFKGTEKFGKGEVAALVERNGGELNAFTSEDVTMYYEVFATDRWELALEIEAERMVNLKIDPGELESERQVILEERAMYRDIPAVELSEELMAASFRESPYRWPIIGWEGDIRAIAPADVMDHYRTYYTPANAGLVVVGAVEPEDVFRMAAEHFGSLPATGSPDRRIPQEPEMDHVTRIELGRPANLPQLEILFRAPEIRSRDSEALFLLANLLSGTKTSRLDLALVETKKAGDVHVQYHAKYDPSTFLIGVEGQPRVGLDEVEGIVWDELEKLAREEVDGDELERTLNQVEAHHLFAMQSPSNRGFILGWHEAHGDAAYADTIVERVRALTPADLRDAAARHFRRDRCGVARLDPDGSRGGGGTSRVSGGGVPGLHGVFCPRRRFRSGVAAAPSVRRLVLDNGMRVFLQTDRTDPVVAMSLLFEAGACLDPDGCEGLATVCAQTLERGTGSCDFVEFSRRFERIGSHFSLGAGAELAHGHATFLSRHAATGLSLVADLLEDPGYREEDVETVRSLASNDVEAREDDLDDVAEDLFIRGVARGHPYERLPHGTREGIGAIRREDLVRFHREAYRPDRGHLAIVGDFDEDAVDKLLSERFGRLPRPDRDRPDVSPLPSVPEDLVLVRSRPEKTQVKIFLGGPGLSASDPDRLAALTLNQVLGGSAIRSRLGDEIRDGRGLAYSVYSRNYERAKGGFFLVHLGTRPENVRGAVEAIREELSRITEGVTERELADARDYLTGSFPLRFTTYGKLARFWTRSSFYGWPEDYLARFVQRIRALTGADLKRAAERLAGGARVLAVAGPVGADLEPSSSPRG